MKIKSWFRFLSPVLYPGIFCFLVSIGLHAEEAAIAETLPNLPQQELLKFLVDKSTFTLIDARSPEEYATSHVDGALNIPADAVEQYLASLPADKNQPLVVYCKTGKRAALVRDALLQRGYADVRVLPGRQLFFTDELIVFNCGV